MIQTKPIRDFVQNFEKGIKASFSQSHFRNRSCYELDNVCDPHPHIYKLKSNTQNDGILR